jgi:hypothetical protein
LWAKNEWANLTNCAKLNAHFWELPKSVGVTNHHSRIEEGHLLLGQNILPGIIPLPLPWMHS